MKWNDQIQSKETVEATEKEAGVENSRDVQSINIEAGEMLSDSIKPTYGPRGANKLLVDQDGNIIVTNNGATILGEMDVEMDLVASAQLMTELALSQSGRYGDGTKAAIILAGDLLSKANDLIDKGLHPTAIFDGYTQSATVATQALTDLAFTPDEDTEWLRSIAMTAMSGRGSGDLDQALTDLIVEATQTVKREGTVNLDHISTTTVRGKTVYDSALVYGLILETEGEPALPSMPLSHSDAGILCLNTLLDPMRKREGKVKKSSARTSVKDPNEIREWAQMEHDVAEQLAQRLDESGINVVVSKENISEKVLTNLTEHDILAFEQLSTDSVDRVTKATGASVVSTVEDLEPTDIGRAEQVEYRKIGREEFLVFGDCENPQTVSLLLRGSTIHTVDETERSIRNGLHTVKMALEADRVLPGGGAPEIEISRALKEHADSVAGRQQLAIKAFADAIENLPEVLARNMAIDPINSLTELHNRHEDGEVHAGIVLKDQVVADVTDYDILEPLSTKKQVVIGATEVANQVLRIDDLIPARQLDLNYTQEFRRNLDENTDIDI